MKKYYYSLSFKLILFTVLIFITFFIIYFVQSRYTQKILLKSVKELSDVSTQKISEEISFWLRQKSDLIKNISKLIENVDFNDDEILKIMKIFLSENEDFFSIYYGTSQNKMINASGWIPPPEFDLRTRPWYTSVLEKDDLIFTNAFLNASQDDVIVTVAHPVKDEKNNLLGVVGGDISVKVLLRKIIEKKPSEKGFLFLIDSRKNILAHPKYFKEDLIVVEYKNIYYDDVIKKIFDNNGLIIETIVEGVEGFVNSRFIPLTNWHIASFIPKDEFLESTRQIFLMFSFIAFFSVIIIFIFIFLEKKYLIKPIENLIKQIVGLDFEKNMKKRINYNKNDEFFYLSESINKLLHKGQEYFIKIKDYEKELQASNEELEALNQEVTTNYNVINEFKERLEKIGNNIPNGYMYQIMILNKETERKFTYISEGVEKISGLSKNEILVNSDLIYSQFFEEDIEDIKKSEKEAIEEMKIFKYEAKIKNKLGDIKWLMISSAPSLDVDNNILFDGIVIDITEHKKTEEEMIRAKKESEEANYAKGRFLANMSHEIRTPLNGVVGFSELLMNTDLTEEQKQYIEHIKKSSYSLLDILNDILDFSKIEAGKLDIEFVMSNFSEIIEDVYNIIKISADKKNLKFLVNLQKYLPDIISVDSLRLKQVLLNLLSNAVKFTDFGEVELKVSFEKTENNRGIFKFSVRDTGIGISKENQGKLFQPFSQVDSSMTRKFGGTGLGLIISQLIVEKMGNRIKIESELNKGSTFYFEIETEYII